jgi:Bacterial Ig-like domain (group 3)
VTSSTVAESVSQSAAAIVLAPHAVLEGRRKVGLTAEVAPVVSGGVVPTGQVTFVFVKKHRRKVTVKRLGTAELSGGQATLTLKLNQVLNKPLAIVYSGDPNFLASRMSVPELTRSAIASDGI